MSGALAQEADAILRRVTSSSPGVPGVAAVVTGKEENRYEGAAGVRAAREEAPMTTDTVCALYSATKAITGTACLQLVEEGTLDLDAPAKEYVPAIGELHVFEGFDEQGALHLRPPEGEVTTRMLLLHTSGLGYNIFNETYARLGRERYAPDLTTARTASLQTPLLFDPGERWEYGSGLDWAGLVVEGITGKRLGEVMRERIFEPLGMSSTAFTMTPDMRSRLARLHQRRPDGTLKPLDVVLPQDPEIHMGGHGLYSTAEDYCAFIRMWLNDGMGPGGSVLKRETVEMAARNHLGGLKIKALPGVIPSMSNDVEFFPGLPKSWGLTFMINEEDAPTGRPAGSLAWAGMANLYYWIDRRNGIGGVWASQVFPFADPASLDGYLDFETAVYGELESSRGG